MTKHQQADGEIHEDQLLNFLVNALTGTFGVSLGENADPNPEDIYKVLVVTLGTVPRGPQRSTAVRTEFVEHAPTGGGWRAIPVAWLRETSACNAEPLTQFNRLLTVDGGGVRTLS